MPLVALVLCLPLAASSTDPVVVAIPLDAKGEVELPLLVKKLAEGTGVEVAPPEAGLRLPVSGLGGTLTKSLLAESLGAGVEIGSDAKSLTFTIAPERLAAPTRGEFGRRLRSFADRVEREAKRRNFYGMYARKSYVPNDPARPTVCLIHGMNSTSSVFLHMVGPIEAAGYGVVVYDFPYNRDLDETIVLFRRDWSAFRKSVGESRPWVVLTHSMGVIPARDYVEGPEYGGDVSSLVMIAPVNGGSYLAKAQTALQFLQGVQSLNGKTRADPLALLGDGLGAAADDLTPGSAILKRLASYPRRSGVRYHIVAGDRGLVTEAVRERAVANLGVLARVSGPSLLGQFEELTDGRGDGCVAVERTRLPGAADHVVLHANHLELIRAPMLFPDPGPVASMPLLLKWLAEDAPPRASKGAM